MIRKATLGVLFLTILALSAMPAAAGRYRDAKRAHKRGDLDRAVFLLVHKLRDKPDHVKSAELLQTVLPAAYERHHREVQKARGRQDRGSLVDEYRAIAKLSDHVETLPAVVGKGGHRYEFETQDVSAELQEALETAADHHYRNGVSLLEHGGGRQAADQFAAAMRYIPDYRDARDLGAESRYRKGKEFHLRGDFKNAAREFRASWEFVPDYQDSSALYSECRSAATKRIAILPFENLSGKAHLGAIGDILSDQVLAKVMSRGPEFLEFVNRDQVSVLLAERGEIEFGTIDAGSAVAAGKLAGVDAFVFGKILLVDEHFPDDEVSDPETASARRRNPTTGQEETVTVTFWEHTRFGHVEVRAAFSVIEAHSGRVLGGNELRDRREDFVRWIMYEGDERAISAWAIERETPGGKRPLIPAQAMVLDAIDAMSSTVASALLGMFD
jgi:hypothetical protein